MIDLEAFEQLAAREYARLPQEVRDLTGEVEIRVADAAPLDVLDAMGLDHPDDLLGLFEGIGLNDASAAPETGIMPNRIWLYRHAILAHQREGEDALDAVVRHVLVHEIGHHFGLSDDEMYAIDDAD
ncbi:metallopeptidase family protein [Acuticoccus sp.]|uniref:metallopeptidase family protein n=1 Tax=Acuticoccus sp. TaxID=1904378 RepID=UPI003B520425